MTFGPIPPADRVKFAKATLAMHDGPPALPASAPRVVRGRIEINLDDADDVARAWSEVERVMEIRRAEPETRQDIVRLLPYLDEGTRAEIERLIDEVPPITILREPGLFAALVTANHRGCSSGCMARSEASRVA
jgi:hypothetical protein